MTDHEGGSHPTPVGAAGASEEEWIGPRLVPGVGEQPPFATERLARPGPDLDDLWKKRATRVVVVALAVLVLVGLVRWFDVADELREPCLNAGFPLGCEEPPGFWRQGQFVLAQIGIVVGLVAALAAGYGAVVGRRMRRVRPAALTYLGLLVAWLGMYVIGRVAW